MLDLRWLIKHFPMAEGEQESKMNIFVWQEGSRTIILLIPRSKHRPDCYSAEGNDQRLVSPGALDMAGVWVTTRPEDFERMDAEEIRKIIQEVGLPFPKAESLANKYKQ